MSTIALMTDQPALAEGFRSFLDGSAHTLLELGVSQSDRAADMVKQMNVDVVLLDWNKEWTPKRMASFCSALPQITVLLAVRDPSPELVYQAQEAGVSGLLDTRSSGPEILSRIARAQCEQSAFDYPEGNGRSQAIAVRMTPREGQMVCLLAQGLKNKEIATTLGLSEGTVKVYLSRLFRKAGAKDRFELALFGLQNMAGFTDSADDGDGASAPNGDRKAVAGLSTLVLRDAPPRPERETTDARASFHRSVPQRRSALLTTGGRLEVRR